uniref:Uncharacterized protein n=1 Tax=Nicotiana tabacum TaxID=4097 RepID=A0A1S4AHE2_TOBAC|nr:PREDICTED: uncharacterized protein LOC107797709 [Nicotiana tabacum]
MTWSDVYNEYQSKIRAEDDQLGASSGSVYLSRLLVKESKLNKERYQPYLEDRRNTPRHNLPRNDQMMDRGKDPRGLAHRTSKIRDAKWPRQIQSDPSQRNYNLVCEFHNMHGHRTEDCHQLREEVAQLLNKGHLWEFLSDRAKNQFQDREATKKNEENESQHVIYMIMGGADAPQNPVMRRTEISITREKRTQGYIPEDALAFSEEDTEALSQPHNDAL